MRLRRCCCGGWKSVQRRTFLFSLMYGVEICVTANQTKGNVFLFRRPLRSFGRSKV